MKLCNKGKIETPKIHQVNAIIKSDRGYNGISLSHKERNPVICDNIDRHRGYYAK